MRFPKPALRRLEFLVLKDKSGTDNAQVPALATIDFYRQGADVAGRVDVGTGSPPPLTTVPVYHLGAVQINDRVQVATSTGLVPDQLLTVIDVVETYDALNDQILLSLIVQNDTAALIALDIGKRLICVDGRPDAYSDASGATVLASGSLETDGITGRVGCYLREYRFDFIVHGSGLMTRLFPDAEGSFISRG